MSQVSVHMGEMASTMATEREGQRDTIRFEPWQMIGDLFREDIVLLMRHGPTDWSKRDAVDVAPTDCGNQRIMTAEGKEDMRNFGILLAGNDLRPSKIVVSQWCRNQETLDAMMEGFNLIDPEWAQSVEVETDPNVSLLLSLQGAPNVTAMRERIAAWDGHDENEGPLLVLSHFTNIDELTEFHVYEGEMLVLDPKRENRVLGYLRLRSATPDVGHFAADGNSDVEDR
ncbi:MAG: hypothetical protein AAGE76_04735 [Pseudomonadota bacterium]